MKFYSNFLSRWFFISFCLFFIFNLYVWGFTLQRIYFAPSSKFPVAVQWAIFFCHLFSFYQEYIFFCRGNISFAITYIFFTMSIFLFPQWTFSCCKISVSLQDFFFWRDLFLSRCKNFSFAASFNKIKLNSDPVYNDEYIKTEIKIYNDKVCTNF